MTIARRLAFLPPALLALACGPTPSPTSTTLHPPSALQAAGAPSHLGYSTPSAIYRQAHSIAPNVPTVTGTVTSWSVSPPLPAGLALDPLSGVIDGRPQTLARPNTYTVTASNANGSTSAPVSIRIVPFAQELDPHHDGQANALHLVSLAWGRLADVYDTDAGGERRLVARGLVIGEDIQTDAADFELTTQLLTGLVEVTIRHALGTSAFESAYDRLQQHLVELPVASPFGLPPYPMLPRDAAIVARFDDLLDASTLGADTLRLVTGVPATKDAPRRVLADANHVGLADPDGDGRFTAYSTRAIVDLELTWIDVLATQGAAPFQPFGLPPSQNVNEPSVVVRIPTVANPQGGPTRVLANLAGHGLSTAGNGPIDVAAPTQDVVRAARGGGPTDVTGDAFDGYLRDVEPPELVGRFACDVLTIASDPGLGRGRFVLDLAYTTTCRHQPLRGDVLVQGTRVFEVAHDAAPLSGNLATGVRVRMIAGFSPLATSAVLATRFDPVVDAGHAACFVSTAADGGAPALTDVDPATALYAQFSEPLDPAAVPALDALFLARTQSNPFAHDVVPARVELGLDGARAELRPLLPLRHVAGSSESYFLSLGGGPSALRDRAGNALAGPVLHTTFQVSAAAPSQIIGGLVLRFGASDEELNDGRPELRGQFLYDFARGTLRPRPVTHFEGRVDRTQALIAPMPAFAPGVRGPLNPLGAKLQSLWRYCDAGFQLLDEQTHNVDVEGLAWAPVGGNAIADSYAQFEIRLAHSKHLPDESLDASLLPNFPNSGLEATYANNLLDAVNDAQRVVHPRARGYDVNPADRYQSGSGAFLMPYPMNRGIPANQREYYTWRDTALLSKGGPFDSPGAELLSVIRVLGLPTAPGVPYSTGNVPTIGLPLLLEFRCFPDGGALGLNAFDVSLAGSVSPRPNFRAFSSGGVNSGGQIVTVNPDTANVATGGFNPTSNPPGLPTLGAENTVFLGAMQLVTRVSRAHTIFFPTGGPATFAEPLIVANAAPPGTSIQLAFRSATSVTGPTNNASNDARTVDFYGAPRAANLPPAGGTVLFLGNDASFSNAIATENGGSFLQVRITFVSNAVTNQSPELTALGLAWRF